MKQKLFSSSFVYKKWGYVHFIFLLLITLWAQPAFSVPFQVNTDTTNEQSVPKIAMDSSGNFAVVWFSMDNGGGDTNVGGAYAEGKAGDWVGRRFNSSGTAIQFNGSTSPFNDSHFKTVVLGKI